MYAFDIERPSSVADAVAALGAEDAQALGGGQTLIPTLKQRLAAPSKLDRKSVVQGKSVDLGGRRIIKKKKTNQSNSHSTLH